MMKLKDSLGITKATILFIPVLLLFACDNRSTKNPPVPAAPSGLNGIALSSSAIFITWTDNADNESGFDIFRRVVGAPAWNRIAQLPENSFSFSDSNLVDSTAYSYYVLAFNATGNSPASAPTTITTSAIGQPPEAPHNQVPWNGADSVALNPVMSWECSDPDGDTLTFDIYLGTGNPPGIARTNYSDTTIQFGLALQDTIYYWQVTAIDPHRHRTPSPVWWFRTIHL